MSVDSQALLRPISEESPCGQDLDEAPDSGKFLAWRIFGSKLRLETRFERKLGPEIKWRDVRAAAEETLARSKDLRVLAHLAAAVVRLEGLESLVATLETASGWLAAYWDALYPRVTEDAAARNSALSDFADPIAILDAVRRLPLVSVKQLGACSFRDLEVAAGKLQAEPDVTPPDAETIDALFAGASFQELEALEQLAARGKTALASIESRMAEATQREFIPDLSGLSDLLTRIAEVNAKYLSPRRATQTTDGNSNLGEAQPGSGAAGGPRGASQAVTVAVGAIASRQDAVKALEAVANFFERNEPSSPVPLFVERTKRLIAMDFIQLLEEIVPDAADHARAAAGIKKATE
jgi:type VI secretion system protein ImpA